MTIYKSNTIKSLCVLLFIAVTLNILRVVIWGKLSFVFILWNIFLAIIPLIISSLLLYFSEKGRLNNTIFIIGIFLWILFIPNAPYIITDLIHIGTTRSAPVLYDAFLLFSSAYVGLIIFFYSLYHIEQIIRTKLSKRKTSIIIGFIVILISFGLYLGRFLRFNSWDIFINHTLLIKNIWKILSEIAIHIEVYMYTLLFFFFLYISYRAWKYISVNK
jgi:uncharacterized membrane protein